MISIITIAAAAAVGVASAFSPSNSKLSQFSVSSCLVPTSNVTPNGFIVVPSRLFDGKSQSIDKYDGDPLRVAQENKNVKRTHRALQRGRAFVKSIMESEYELIPDSDGMSVLRNVIKLETGEAQDVVLRNITIPFWQQCLEIVNTSGKLYRVAAIGASGIGKSTATAILIRMLLQQRKTVVYHIRTQKENGWYYEFVPGPNNSMVTNVYPEKMINEDIPSLEISSTFYIVDPGNTSDDCNPPSDFEPKVILVLSPDSGHWGGPEFVEGQDGVIGFLKSMPLWTLDELLFAQPIIRPDLTVGVVRDLYRFFDGVPCDVFMDYSDSFILDQKMKKMQKISFFDKDKMERKAILARMICVYIHAKQQLQADFPNTSHCYKIHDSFSAIDNYWIINVQSERFEETLARGILYCPDTVDEMVHLVDTALNRKELGKGIMIKGPHGIGKSHSIVNLVRKLLYDSNGKYLVTFVPDCEKWSNLGNLYEAICNSFGCTRTDIGANVEERNESQFEEFIEIIDKILTEKGMKWVFVFDQINALFARPEHKESKNVATLPFPFKAIKGVMKGGRITTIISASANNEISYRDSHPDFMEYDHSCSMSAHEINAVLSGSGRKR